MAAITKRGKSWYLSYYEQGQQIRVSLGPVSKDEARRTLKAKEAELAGYRIESALTLTPEFDGGPLFSQFIETYLSWYQTEYPTSYARVASICDVWLVDYFGDSRIGSITKQQVEEYKAYRPSVSARSAKDGAAPPPPKTETIIKELRVLQAIMNKAVEWEVIPRNPISGVKSPKLLDSKPPRWYTADELGSIYKASPDKHAIWRLLANTGLRRSEALALVREEHVGTDSIRVLSTKERRTKSGKWREIPLSPGARQALDDLPKSGYLLPRVHPFSLSRAFTRSLKRAKLDGNLHCLRHTYCSHLVMQGIPLRTVQLLAGHASMVTTEKYAHLSPDHITKAAATLCL